MIFIAFLTNFLKQFWGIVIIIIITMTCSYINNIGAVNNFIQVRFDFASSKILCIFSDEATNSVKHCEITYGPNECDNALLISYGQPSASQIVEISLSLNVLRKSAVLEQEESYCYKIKGMNRTNTITISGRFVTGMIYNTFHDSYSRDYTSL